MPPHMGGIEIIGEGLFRAYRKAGCEVKWIASRVPPETLESENGKVRVKCWNVLERLLGVPWPVWAPSSLSQLTRIIHWADVLHIHDCLYFGSVLTTVLARRVRKPVLLSQHIGEIEYPSRILNVFARLAYRSLGKWVLRKASHVVYCTPFVEHFVEDCLGLSLKKSSCIPLGVDTSRFRPPSPGERKRSRLYFGLPDQKKVVLFVGRLLEKKGARLFQEVARRSQGYHFFMVGDGPLRPIPQTNLTWVPVVKPEQMEFVYQSADAFLLPSSSEGFPLSVMESMSSGIPVIINKKLPIFSQLEGKGVCLAAEPLPHSFCETLKYLMDSSPLAFTLGRQSRRLAEQEFGIDTMSARYLGLILSIGSLNRT